MRPFFELLLYLPLAWLWAALFGVSTEAGGTAPGVGEEVLTKLRLLFEAELE